MHGRDEERRKSAARSPGHHVGATSGARIGGTEQRGPFGHQAISRHRLIRLYDGLPVSFPHWLPPLPSPAAWYRPVPLAGFGRYCSTSAPLLEDLSPTSRGENATEDA